MSIKQWLKWPGQSRGSGTGDVDPVMLSLKTLSCLNTVFRQILRCIGLGLGLASFILEFTHIATKERFSQNDLDCFTKSDAILAKYLATINHEDFYADEQTNVFVSHEYSVNRLLFCRLLSVCLLHLHL